MTTQPAAHQVDVLALAVQERFPRAQILAERRALPWPRPSDPVPWMSDHPDACTRRRHLLHNATRPRPRKTT